MKSSVASKQESVPVEMFLRIQHPTLNPDDITEELGIEPEHTVHAGPASSRSGVRRLHSESYWLARLPSLGLRERMVQGMSPVTKEQLSRLRDATQYDVHILDALQPLLDKKEFLQKLTRVGSIVLLVQRTDRTAPLALRTSLVRLTELGIAIELD
jgi:hypothetical protein